MELRYPLLFIITIIFIIIYVILYKKKKNKYTTGSKIANTHFLKENKFYQSIIKKYRLLFNIIKILGLLAIITCCLLISRPSKIKSTNINQYNRDIFLCMDVSASVDELNSELVNNLKDTVKSLKNERFGISIFNTSSIVLVPLTDDYDYVIDVLNQIGKSIELNNSSDYDYTNDDYFYIKNYIISGTQEGSDLRGSSLIGDGLASCVYNFSNLDEERSRIIILSTDNDLAGDPLVTLSKATDISVQKNIKVFGIGTRSMKKEDKIAFKTAVEKTQGKFYEHSSSTVKDIVNDIEKTSKSLLKNQNEVKQSDIPIIFFLPLLIFIFTFIILDKKVR